MEILPAESEVADDYEDVEVCRICQSPEEPNNPLRHPCACRGSLKYVHPQCLFLWINRRRRHHCEICMRSYSFAPIYSENSPEKLTCHEFLVRLLLRALSFIKLALPWLVALPFNAYCFNFHPRGWDTVFENQRFLGISLNSHLLGALFYTADVMSFVTHLVFLRVVVEEYVRLYPEFQREIFIENGLEQRVLQVFLKHMRILCDWWHDHLLQFPFFHLLQRGPFALAFVPRNPQFHEFGAIRRFLFLLDDNAFAVLAINIYMSSLNIFLPFFIGRVALLGLPRSPDSWIGQNAAKITVGKIILLHFFSDGIRGFLTRRRNSIPARVGRFSQSSVAKNVFIVCFKIGCLPLILGCWLDFCTFPMTGTIAPHKLEILSDYLLMATNHWFRGILYLIVAYSFMECIHKIVKKRAFRFLLDVADPNYKITNLHLGHILFVFAFHGAVVVIVFHLPIKAITLISQSFFPLHLWDYHEELMLGLIVAHMCILSVGPVWLANFIKPSIKSIVQKWIITVSSWLQVSDILLGTESSLRADHNVEPRFQMFGLAEGSIVSLCGSQSDNTCEDTDDPRDERLMLKIALLLFLAASTLFLFSTVSMALPILVGRTFFNSISFVLLNFGLKHNDSYAFWIGCYILRAIYISTCFIFNHIQTGRAGLLLKHLLLFSIWISVIPGLVGLLIHLMVITPLRVSLNESPVHFWTQDWLIGLVVLHIWILLTIHTRINCFTTTAWRKKLERIKNTGISRLPFTWLLRSVIGSIINTLLTILCIPYVVANCLFPLLRFPNAVNLAVQRIIWPTFLALIALWLSAKLICDLIIYLHRVEFDKRYKVGVKVVDFTD